MNRVRVWIVAMLLAVPALAAAQEAKQTSLENTLWDVDQQWLCDGPYQKPYAECVKFRSQYWVDGFFEVQSGGTLRNKEEMVASQSAANVVPREDRNGIVQPLLALYFSIWASGGYDTVAQSIPPSARPSRLPRCS